MEPGTPYNLHVIALTKDNAEGWRYMPPVLSRIQSFCDRYDTDSKGWFMAHQVTLSFASEKSNYLCLAILSGDKVVGHAVASLVDWGGTAACVIVQYECDVKVPKEIADRGFEIFQQWAWEQNPDVNKFQAFVKERKLVDHFKTWGFRSKYVVMETQGE